MALADAFRFGESSLLSPKSAGRFLSQIGLGLRGIWVYPFPLKLWRLIALSSLWQFKPPLIF